MSNRYSAFSLEYSLLEFLLQSILPDDSVAERTIPNVLIAHDKLKNDQINNSRLNINEINDHKLRDNKLKKDKTNANEKEIERIQKETKKEIIETESDTEDSAIEEDDENETPEENLNEEFTAIYDSSFEMEGGLYQTALDYEQLFSYKMAGVVSKFYLESEDEKSNIHQADPDYMDDEEAEATIKDIQLAQITGTYQDIDMNTRRRLAMWAMFNSSLLELYHREHILTGDVNYSRTI